MGPHTTPDSNDLREADPATPIRLYDVWIALRQRLPLVLFGSVLAAIVALGGTYLLKPVFVSRTVFLPPQQQQSSAATALASLGALAGVAGTLGNIKSPADQYVSLMQSRAVTDRIIDDFKLMNVYGKQFRSQARRELDENTKIGVGKKDGLITVEVEDHEPQRAADIANRYVDELRRLTDELALSEAQQRRVFFEAQLKQTKERLVRAQQALESSGYSQGALRAEPKAAAESYAKLRAEVTAAEVRLQALRRNLLDSTPEVQGQQAALATLRAELAKAERSTTSSNDPDYIGRYREFKYQETLFELFARQYELARLDESREGALIQVVDRAAPADLKSWPKRGLTAGLAGALAFILLTLFAVTQAHWRRTLVSTST